MTKKKMEKKIKKVTKKSVKVEEKEVKKEEVKQDEKPKEEPKKEIKVEEKKEEPKEIEEIKPEEVEEEPEVIAEVKGEIESVEELPKKVAEEEKKELRSWVPKTIIGKDVMKGEVTDINKILDEGIRIREPEIVDFLVPNMESELILIGGRPGKGGGIERTPMRISAKMHKSGRRYTCTAFTVVGNKDGIIGIGKGRAKDSRGAIEKAMKQAKLNLIKVMRGCGSWECGCGTPHSIPFKTEGKAGSVRINLLPAPRGIGLAVDDETKKILTLAGIKDIWGKTLGSTQTRINLIMAVFDALRNLHRYRTGK